MLSLVLMIANQIVSFYPCTLVFEEECSKTKLFLTNIQPEKISLIGPPKVRNSSENYQNGYSIMKSCFNSPEPIKLP